MVSSLNPEVGLLQGKLRLNSWLLFCALAVLCSCAQQINYPVPGVTSLSPTSITAGQPGFTLTVNGSNFTPATSVVWNGQARSTVFQGTSVLTAQIQASDIANPGLVVVSVFTPQPGGGSPKNPLQFTVAAGDQSGAAYHFDVTAGSSHRAPDNLRLISSVRILCRYRM